MSLAGVLGAIGTLAILMMFQWALVLTARKYAVNRTVTFWDLIVTTEDERYSLSRLQFYLWFVTILVSYGAMFFAQRRDQFVLPDVSEQLYVLMGLITASTVTSTVITFTKKAAWNPGKPNFFVDVFLDSKDSLDLPRTQMFTWTLVIIIVYVTAVFKSLGADTLPSVPAGLIVLMGISNAAYLGAKAAEPVQAKISNPQAFNVKTIADLASVEPHLQWSQAADSFAQLVIKARQSNLKANH